jgi:uncharacterized membrane protein
MIRTLNVAAASCTFALSSVAGAGVATTGYFESFGVLPGGGFSIAYGVNADGSVVVGGGNSPSGDRAMRWTPGGGSAEIPGSTDPVFCVSGNGLRAASTGVIYTHGGATLNIGGGESIAMNHDGTRLVSISTTQQLWQEGTGWRSLPGFGAGADITPDGQWVLGTGSNMTRWSEATGTQVLGPGRAGNISADGRTVSGDRNLHLTRWREGIGFDDLGTFPNTTSLAANGMSDDGSVIVGFASVTPPGGNARPTPFIWTEQTGLVSLRTFLIGQGIPVSGWTLVDVFEVSNDGRTIVGFGINPDSQFTGYIAHVPTLPAPSAAVLLLGSSLMATATRRRRP